MSRSISTWNRERRSTYNGKSKNLKAYASGAKCEDQFLAKAVKRLEQGRLLEIDRDIERFISHNYEALLAIKDQLAPGQREALERFMKNDENRRYERFLKAVEGQ